MSLFFKVPSFCFKRLLSIALNWKIRATDIEDRLFDLSGLTVRVKGKAAALVFEVSGIIRTVGISSNLYAY